MANIANTIGIDEIKARTKQLGEEDAKGKDTQIKFHLQVFEGSFHGVLSNDKDKHGKGIDDATMLSEVYHKARQANVIWDAKASNQRKLISTARTDIRGGQWGKGGSNEPLNTVHKLMSIWQNQRKVPQNAGKMDDAVNVLHRYLRLQLKRNSLLEDDELRGLCFKKIKDPRSLEKFWEDTEKTFKKLKLGTLAASTLQDDHSLVAEIQERIKDRREALRLDAEIEAEEEAERLEAEASEAAEAAEEAKAE
jgi:hypothetical protein